MSVNVLATSRLQFKDLLVLDGVELWELDPLPPIPQRYDDIYIQVADTDRVDLLASRFYNDPQLWWVIAVANDLELLPSDLVVGATIRIPSPAYVASDLFQGLRSTLAGT